VRAEGAGVRLDSSDALRVLVCGRRGDDCNWRAPALCLTVEGLAGVDSEAAGEGDVSRSVSRGFSSSSKSGITKTGSRWRRFVATFSFESSGRETAVEERLRRSAGAGEGCETPRSSARLGGRTPFVGAFVSDAEGSLIVFGSSFGTVAPLKRKRSRAAREVEGVLFSAVLRLRVSCGFCALVLRVKAGFVVRAPGGAGAGGQTPEPRFVLARKGLAGGAGWSEGSSASSSTSLDGSRVGARREDTALGMGCRR
jgi:hypothetical protein